MSLTVIVRLTDREVRLTFDATQRVVVGRGASSDVRLPDASVSHRHATLRAQEGDFLLVDEGSANGTFVGGVRVAPHTSRIVRSGDRVRIGRITLELRMEQAPATRDVSLATRDLALALVARSMRPEDTAPRLRIVEGPDQGAVLALLESERIYVIGRGTHCDLPLADADASRDHAHAVRRGAQVFARDLGTKNGTWLGPARAPANEEALWRPAHVVQIGKTVIALEEPTALALAAVEAAADEPLVPDEASRPDATPASVSPRLAPEPTQASAMGAAPPAAMKPRRGGRSGGWSIADFAVMAAAAAVLALSLAGLLWLLRGG
jgi:pSer/pThr/pTyr-binding forkhead associated (FHA) protein